MSNTQQSLRRKLERRTPFKISAFQETTVLVDVPVR